MKFKELKVLPHVELREKIVELRKELIKENAQVAIGTVPKNPRKLRLAKKTIARIVTILAVKPNVAPVAAPAKAAAAAPKKEALKK